MKITLFSTVSAIALTGLCFTLTSTANAHDFERRGHFCKSLPKGCRSVSYRGERCWFGGGHYYRTCASGYEIVDQATYETSVVAQPVYQEEVIEQPVVKKVIIERPIVKKIVVERPVVEEKVVEQPVVEEKEAVDVQPVQEESTTVEQPVYEDEEAVTTLPEHCSAVYVGGERCWFNNGFYFRKCAHGFTKFHCHERSHTRGHVYSRAHDRR